MTLFLNLAFVPLTFHYMFPICCPRGYKVNIRRGYYRQIDKSFKLCGGLSRGDVTHTVPNTNTDAVISHAGEFHVCQEHAWSKERNKNVYYIKKMKPFLRTIIFFYALWNSHYLLQKYFIVIIVMLKRETIYYSYNLTCL